MPADKTYSRVSFVPADTCALGPVRVFAPDGVTLVRTIPVAALRARDAANEKEAAKRPPECAPRKDWFVIPTVPRRKKPKVERD